MIRQKILRSQLVPENKIHIRFQTNFNREEIKWAEIKKSLRKQISLCFSSIKTSAPIFWFCVTESFSEPFKIFLLNFFLIGNFRVHPRKQPRQEVERGKG